MVKISFSQATGLSECHHWSMVRQVSAIVAPEQKNMPKTRDPVEADEKV
jgi:hypothetical protein